MSMLKSLQSLRNVATIFHKASVPASSTLLRRVETAYPDRAALPFSLEVTEAKPTQQQIQIIEEFDPSLTREIERNGIKYPLVVDWFGAKASMGSPGAGMAIVEALAEKNK